jgi:phosphotransferase system enzyme I (PtsI)
MLRMQLRAILRAALRGKVRILLPMVTCTDEVALARAHLATAAAELAAGGIAAGGDIPLGVMIEVPAAALIASRLATVADFFAIGTNDLIQYALAIDRGNEAVAYLYEPLHPAVLTLLRGVVDAATARGLRLSVCGEMAAHPLFAVVLVGLGVTELSMSPAAIPLVRRVIGAITAQDARAIAAEVLALEPPTPPAALVRRRLLSVLPPDVASLLEESSP